MSCAPSQYESSFTNTAVGSTGRARTEKVRDARLDRELPRHHRHPRRESVSEAKQFRANEAAADLAGAGYDDDLPRGVILGTVDLVEMFATEMMLEFWESPPDSRGKLYGNYGPQYNSADWERGEREKLYGNYDPDRYAWRLENPRMFSKPIPAKGHLGLWNWEGATE